MAKEFKLPELGENIETADILDVLVSVGDTIDNDTPVLEIETDKATIEVPSDAAGVVKEVLVSAGESASIGQVILRLEPVEAQAEGGDSPQPEAQEKEPEPEPATKKEPQPTDQAPEPEKVAEPATVVAVAPTVKTPASNGASSAPRRLAPAAPSTRRLAREIGVDINQVPGSGPGGRISQEDVKSYAKTLLKGPRSAPSAPAASAATVVAPPLPDFSRWGEARREKMTGIRRKTAEQMHLAWSTIPQVTQFDKADITDLEAMRKQLNQSYGDPEAKITVTAILLKVLASALKKFPNFNASIDMTQEEIVYKDFYNVGVAVDTERGLLVPVIKKVGDKNVVDLARSLNQMAEKARNRKVTPDDLQGACITITNLGGIGGNAFTPIVNPPEVAIVGVSRAEMEPVFSDGKFRARLRMPLCLSYDHRLIDGADAARFLRWVCQALENPALLAFEG